MRGTTINNFFNFKRKYKVKHKTYHFDRTRYELILLKQLEDNKIFYNGIIYESNFLHYHKLDAFVQKIYALRDEYILRNFQILYRKEIKRSKKFSRKYNFINQEWIPYKYPYKIFKSVDDILKEGNTFNSYQIKILVNALFVSNPSAVKLLIELFSGENAKLFSGLMLSNAAPFSADKIFFEVRLGLTFVNRSDIL